ncbi:uncharacterized protein LOC129278516 [Lytechinus pictus]|uniref:uncharacterized protein LOC129278516 n=1 Tax=Lytechinus pictus TaxID=7653 RepID=UPI0030BA244A
MKSVPLTSRGPVDDDNFPWVESQTRNYQSKGEIGMRGLRHQAPHSSPHRRSRTTGSVASSNVYGDRETVVLPKIATGRSARSAKKLWKDYENIKIKTVIQNELETPRIPPLYVPKNPKPLYKRPVDEWKPFDILHFREFAETGEIEPEDVTNCNEFYSQITFLRNAVRNVDGTTSYQNLCKKPRSWSEPSVVDDQSGLIAGNRLHWQSAASSLPHPRMLLPLKPGPTTKWYAWRVSAPKEKQKSKRNHQIDHHVAFSEAFSPRVAPHPTPAFKPPNGTPRLQNSRNQQVPGGIPSDPQKTSTTKEDKVVNEGSSKTVEPAGITFITESKEENVDSVGQRGDGVVASQDTPKDNTGKGQESKKVDEQNVVQNEKSVDVIKESGDGPKQQEDTDVETKEADVDNGDVKASQEEEQSVSGENNGKQSPTNEAEIAEEETTQDQELNEGDPETSQDPGTDIGGAGDEGQVADIPDEVDPGSENVLQEDGAPDLKDDMDASHVEEGQEANDQPNETEEVPEDAEGAQAVDDPGTTADDQDGETGERPEQSSEDEQSPEET